MRLKSRYLVILGIVLLLASVYALLGVMQAAMLFTGARALLNANVWGSVWLLAVAGAASAFALAWRRYRGPLPSRRPWILRIVGIGCLLAATWLSWCLISEAVAIDACHDHGGSFDYIHDSCDYSTPHPSLSFFGRSGFLAATIGLLVAVGFMSLRRKRAVSVQDAKVGP
jgi:hypothetical protein